jgi:ferredoxin
VPARAPLSGSAAPRRSLRSAPGPRLQVDPIACDGHGLCAELLPELISLDDWGYPILHSRDVPAHLVPLARRARDLCPTLALLLNPD